MINTQQENRFDNRKSEGLKMTQRESCVYLIRELLQEAPRYSSLSIPNSAEEKKLLRSLFNIRLPHHLWQTDPEGSGAFVLLLQRLPCSR